MPIVITYALQLSWHERVIEVKPFLQTVSAESIGPQARSLPNPVTVVKNFRYETGNVYVPVVPVTPCIFSVSVAYLLISYALHCAVQKERKIAKSWAFYGTKKYHGSFDIRDTFLLQ